MFIIDKYAPKDYTKSKIHKNILDFLNHISKDDSIPHIIFYGEDGVGKKRIIKLFLEMIFGKTVNDIKETLYSVSGSGNKIKDVVIRHSDHHIIIDPVDNNFDKYLIQDVVKEYAKKIKTNIYNNNENNKLFKSILINNLDNLSYYAQTSLRRTLEKYSTSCRFVMWCNSLSRVIEPLKSRCICIRVPSPNFYDMFKLAINIGSYEKLNLKIEEYNNIIFKSNGSLRKLLWKLNLIKSGQSNLKYDTPFEELIENIVDLIFTKKYINIIPIRLLIYNLIITNIEPNFILKKILESILNRNITDDKKLKIISFASHIDHNLTRRRREITHIESFIINVMELLL